MAVVIPSTDVANYAIYSEITTLTTAITQNPLVAAPLTQLQQQLQWQLVQNLMAVAIGQQGGGGSHLQPSTILSTCTVNT